MIFAKSRVQKYKLQALSFKKEGQIEHNSGFYKKFSDNPTINLFLPKNLFKWCDQSYFKILEQLDSENEKKSSTLKTLKKFEFFYFITIYELRFTTFFGLTFTIYNLRIFWVYEIYDLRNSKFIYAAALVGTSELYP